MDINAIEKQALHLPIGDRARLAQRLLESLDKLSEADAEQLWVEAAQRRAAEIDRGEVSLVSAEELEQRVQARLK